MQMVANHHPRLRGVPGAIAKRIRTITPRQLMVLLIVGTLGAAILVTSALGQVRIALAVIGLVGAMTVLAVLQLRRRMGKEIRGIAHETASAVTRAETVLHRVELEQHRILAVIEGERAAAAERHQVLAAQHDALAEKHQALVTLLGEIQRTDEVAFQSVLAAIENERLTADRRHSTALIALQDSQKAIVADQQRLQRHTNSVQRDETREVEALLQLFRGFVPRAPMPSSGGGWALKPTGVLELLFHIDRLRPKVVLELGSGTSSVWIAYALEKIDGRLVALDHEARYADQTRSQISMHGLDKVAEVRLAPLQSISVNGEDFAWYDLDALTDVDSIDLLLVDGPPGMTGAGARYPALPVLEPKLASNAMVILDDVDRGDEQRILERWCKDVPHLRREHQIFGRQAVLSYSRPI